jgi:hypothetical protein
MMRTMQLAGILGLLVTSAFSQMETITLQPFEMATITTEPAADDPESRVLISFDLSSMPTDIEIQYAGLMLTDQDGVPWDALYLPVLVGAVTQEWDASSASWDGPSSGDSWENPGGDWDISLTAYRVLVRRARVPLKLPVTRIVRQWLAGDTPNYGFVALMLEPEEQSDLAGSFTADVLNPSLQIRYHALSAERSSETP